MIKSQTEVETFFAQCRRGAPYTQLRPFEWRPVRLWKLRFVFMAVIWRLNALLCRCLSVPVRKHILPRPRMRVINRGWSRMAVLTAGLLAFATAHANSVRIDDRAGVLGASASVLKTETDRWPFDLKVITARYETTSDQDLEVHRCSDTPVVVCISIDVARKSVVAHFGWGAGVNPRDFDRITGAGKFLLAAGDWRSGIEAMADRAALSVIGETKQLPMAMVQPEPPQQQKIVIENGWMIFIATILAIGGLYVLMNWDEVLSWWKRGGE